MFIKREQKRLAYQMLVFDEVVNRGSFTSAAEVLGHTKSAISTYINQLEQSLGTRLLNRSTRQLNLTAAGEKLAKRSEQLVDLMALTLEEIHSHQQIPTGRLAITAPHAFESGLVTPIVSNLVREFPQLSPELLFTDERLDLLEHQLDMAISVGLQKDSSYHAILMGHLDAILVASPSYLARCPMLTAESLSEQTWVILPWQEPTQLITYDNESLLLHAEKKLKVNTSISAINSVLCGIGIALLPTIFVRQYLVSGEMQQVLSQYHGRKKEVYALHSYQSQLPFVLRQFVDKLKAAFHLSVLNKP